MERKPVSQEEMQAYLNGELTKSEMHDIELRLQANDMASEAMEGFEAHPGAIEGLSAVQDQFRAKLAKQKTWLPKHTLIAAGLLGVSVMGAAYLFRSNPSNQEAINTVNQDSLTTETTLPDLVHFTFEDPIEITEEIELEVDAAEILPQERQLTAQYVGENQPITVEAPETIEPGVLDSLIKSVAELAPIEPIVKKMPEAVQPEKVVKSNVKILFLNNLMVVDYTNLRGEGIEQKTLAPSVNTGTPAFMENPDDEINDVNKAPQFKVTYIDYIDFLRETQKKFDKNDFKGALKDYHRILKQYPDDVNAQFYGGLCYYNLDKPDRAIQYFEKVIANNVNTFHPEGEFYLALSLRATGQYGKGNGMLLKIAEEGGFYAKQAKEIIDQ